MQAIITKYLPCTNLKGSRIKAKCEAGSITIGYPYELSGAEVHIAACKALQEKLAASNAKRHGTDPSNDPWLAPMVTGQLPGGEYAHVFITGTIV